MKNLKLNIVLLAMGLIFMVSCKDEEKTAETTTGNTEATTPASTDEAPELNPAHGEPGHRCELPVGAPLNQSAGSTSTQTPTSNSPSTSVSPVRVDQSPKINPPHGEPGHDCAVPVGQPLDN